MPFEKGQLLKVLSLLPAAMVMTFSYPPADHAPNRPQVNNYRLWQRIQPRLDQADRQTAAEIDRSLAIVREFFDERKDRVRPFAQRLLSLRGKWNYVRGQLPSADRSEYFQFLADSFRQTVFSPEELRQVIERADLAYLDGARRAENQLLLDIQTDAADFRGPAIDSRAAGAAMQAQLEQLTARLDVEMGKQLGVNLAGETVTWFGSDVAATLAGRMLAAVGARLGVSCGVLSAGVGSTVASFGIGLAAAIVVDMGVDFSLKLGGYDPEAEVAAKVQATLDNLCTLLTEGDRQGRQLHERFRRMEREDPVFAVREQAKKSADDLEKRGLLDGLRQELQRLDKLRSGIRRQELFALVMGSGQ